ncbi:caffeine synthase 1 [Amborella trichopoda]|uniref:Uncharacterized protein n=1 Tax=Amborella trichopoda TaxID=13333 RepID=W1NFR3_AMBTC|nr:caffeine synthase 1 [Amborella trichopoda]ERM94637.1 hypothetical protein AMTR_s00011p00195230 [Amborella trichopoda]|eukprot:XP_006878492.1 caffeine synthase 1 [Amborella trichopoda]
MDVEKVLHMKGEGTYSYADNSEFQGNTLNKMNSIIEEAVMNMLSTNYPESIGIADLGCASGPNTFSALITIVGAVCHIFRKESKPLPELRIYLNDLWGNDFNSVFKAFPSFLESIREKEEALESCFVAGVPGSFYQRILPANSLHLVHSSHGLHWLSKVPEGLNDKAGLPLNKGKTHVSQSSPSSVPQAYLHQFQKDFSLFLKLRSKEMVSDGRMVLSFAGRKTSDPCEKEDTFYTEQLSEAFAFLVSKGVVDEGKLDSFNMPRYHPCEDEVRELIDREQSFTIERFEPFERCLQDWLPPDIGDHGRYLAKVQRGGLEVMIIHHFGKEIVDDLFEKYSEILNKVPLIDYPKRLDFALVLRKSD